MLNLDARDSFHDDIFCVFVADLSSVDELDVLKHARILFCVNSACVHY